MSDEREFRALSRIFWRAGNEGAAGTTENIRTGALLRAADALERIAAPVPGAGGRDYWRDRATDLERELATERRRVRALRAALKKAKGKS